MYACMYARMYVCIYVCNVSITARSYVCVRAMYLLMHFLTSGNYSQLQIVLTIRSSTQLMSCAELFVALFAVAS